jgi:uncharacterized protein YlxW (UPF0749 family)
MAPWLVPAIKAVLPHLGSIVSAAVPVFTQQKGKEAAAAAASTTTQQQIAELQAAASQNDQNIRELAAQLQQTVTALETAAAQLDKQLTRTRWLAGMAIAASVTALVLSAMGLFPNI